MVGHFNLLPKILSFTINSSSNANQIFTKHKSSHFSWQYPCQGHQRKAGQATTHVSRLHQPFLPIKPMQAAANVPGFFSASHHIPEAVHPAQVSKSSLALLVNKRVQSHLSASLLQPLFSSHTFCHTVVLNAVQ